MRSRFYFIKKQILKYFNLVNNADKLTKISKTNKLDINLLILNLKTFQDFKPAQKDTEITFLLDLIKENHYQNLCEIGSYKGGSLFLLCQAALDTAKIISIDIQYPIARKHAHRKFIKKGQRLFCIQGDTKDSSTFRKTKKALNGQYLDFLFIDGDHSLFGVMNDYIRFSPLVRKGGIIAFHDIHPDSYMQSGNKSPAYVGDVPTFWDLIKKSGAKTKEIIEDADQDGFGIGIIYKE